jgi:hypothetical protein
MRRLAPGERAASRGTRRGRRADPTRPADDRPPAASHRALPTALVLLAAILPYLPAVRGEFLRDDVPYVLHNAVVVMDRPWSDLFTQSLPPHSPLGLYRPLTTLTFRLDRLVGGTQPLVYHLSSIALHALACVLLLFLLRRLGLPQPWAALAAALFAVHPSHVEPVCSISARSELLAFIAVLGALFQVTAGRPGRLGAAGGFVAALAACLAKESGIIVLPLAALVVLLPGPALEHRAARLIPVALGCASAVTIKWLTTGAIGLARAVQAFPLLGPGERALLAVRLLGFDYPAMVLWPGALRHEDPLLYAEPLLGAPLAAGVVVVTAGALAAWRAVARRSRWVVFVLFWFVAALLPYLHLFTSIGETTASRFLFAASVAPAVGAAVLARHLAGARPARGAIVLAGIVFAAAACSTWRARDYRSEAALWQAELGRHADSPYAIYFMGVMEAARAPSPAEGQRRLAAALDRALAVAPSHPYMLFLRAQSKLDVEAQPLEALALVEKLAAVNPDYIFLDTLRGRIAAQVGRGDEALRLFEAARVENRWDALARFELARDAEGRGANGRAAMLIEEAIPGLLTPQYSGQLLVAVEQLARLCAGSTLERCDVGRVLDDILSWVPEGTVDPRGRPMRDVLETYRPGAATPR